ncbi:hypothetical protein ASF69_01035 [Rhizobium sp. Leaf311]|nr:hypothetical protein ASF69_01035 [Rhizobium sp. Leaf311]
MKDFRLGTEDVFHNGISGASGDVKGKIAGTVGLSSRGSGEYDRRRRDVTLLPPEIASDEVMSIAAKLNDFRTCHSHFVQRNSQPPKLLNLCKCLPIS